ncbi:MAG: YfhO family protein [Ruthenibacterium sp.]
MHKRMLKKENDGYLLTFGLCCAAAFFIFLPFLVVDGGLFQYCGDFNSQQIPFYTYMNDFVKHSAGQWSWETDLGGSAVNSYAFYLFGSPFFWLSTLLPAAWVPFCMVPLLILKFGVAGLGAFCYLRRYAKTRNMAVVCACLYALSGFTVYNVFFNHFVDCVALFPFLLWALDAFLYDGRRGAFALLVAINCVNNYFFFAGQIVFLLLYFFAKLALREYRLSWRQFGVLVFEAVLGVAMGAVLLWPAVLCLKDNPRTVDLSSGWGFLMYSKVQQYFAIFTSLFLPPDPPYLPSIYTEGVVKWTSMSAFLPVVSCAGVLAYVRAHKKSAVTKILWICFFMAFVPVLNSAFYTLNSSYYARWFYMPMLLMCAATLHVLEDSDADIMGALKTVACITLSFAVFGLVPAKTDETWSLGVAENPEQFWLMWLLALLGLLLFYIVLHFWRSKRRFASALLSAVLGFSVLYSVIHIAVGKFPQWEGDYNYRSECYESARAIEWPQDENDYRIDAYECYDNVGLWTGKSCLQFFNSVVTPSIMEFYPSVGVKRDVSSKPEAELYALRGLLGAKYTLVPKDSADAFVKEHGGEGWCYAFESGAYEIYENENYVGMGFAYDKYISLDGLKAIAEKSRGNMLVRAIALDEGQIARYAQYMQPAAGDDVSLFNYTAYQQDIAARRAQALSSFAADGSGFTATISLDKANLVFFAVPYDSGFTAEVNGQETPIEKVSNGLCAVLCPAGDNTIVFRYKTPGLALSAAVSLGACGAWLLYCGGLWYLRKKRRSGACMALPGAPAPDIYDALLLRQDTPKAATENAAAPQGESALADEQEQSKTGEIKQ